MDVHVRLMQIYKLLHLSIFVKSVLWSIRLGFSLKCQYPKETQIQDLTAPFLNKLPANGLGKQ